MLTSSIGDRRLLLPCAVRRWSWAALVAVVVLASGCASIDRVDIGLEAATWIEGSQQQPPLTGTLDFGAFDKIDLSQSALLKSRNVTSSDIDRAEISSFWLEVRDPANGQDLAFLDEITVYVDAPGLARERAASGSVFPAGKRHVKLFFENKNLAPWATADSMSFSAEVSGKAPPQRTKIVAEVTLTVDINVRGLLR